MTTPGDHFNTEEHQSAPIFSQEYDQNAVQDLSAQKVVDKEREMAELLITMDNYTPIVSSPFMINAAKQQN